MKLKIALLISLITNFLLIITLVINIKGKRLPAQEPDFEKVRQTIIRIISEEENRELFSLTSFNTGKWLSIAAIKQECNHPTENWDRITSLASRIGRKCKLPVRIAGSYNSASNPKLYEGIVLEIGYSKRAGYNVENNIALR